MLWTNMRRSARNVWRSKWRASVVILITAFGLALALTTLVMRLSVENQIDALKESVGTRVSVRPTNSFGAGGIGFRQQAPGMTLTESLDADLFEKVTAVPHVASAQRYLTGMLATGDILPTETSSRSDMGGPGGMGGMRRGQMVMGIEAGSEIRMLGSTSSEIVEGRTFTAADAGKKVTILGQTLAEDESLKVGDSYTVDGVAHEVIGIMTTGARFGDTAIVLQLDEAQSLLDQDGKISQIELTVDSIDNIDAVVAAVEEIVGEDADVVSEVDQAMSSVGRMFNTVKTFTTAGVVMSVAIVAAVLFLTMLLIVKQRTKEIGVLKAIGATRRDIMQQFITEAVIFALFGALVGTALFMTGGEKAINSIVSAASSQTANVNPDVPDMPMPGGIGRRSISDRFNNAGISARIGDIDVNLDWRLLLYGLLGTMAIGALGGLIPAGYAASLKPAEVLRND